MSFITENMKWIMLASGVLTLSMLQAVIAPRATIRSMFGEDLTGDAAALVVRNWGGLVVGGGAMLIFAAYVPEWRPLVLIYVGAGKASFIALVVARGGRYLTRQAGIAAALNGIMVCLFVLYLLATRAG